MTSPMEKVRKKTLVLDNAPYHHCHGEEYIDTKNLKRKELFSELIITAEKNTMDITRGGREVEVHLRAVRGSKRGSTAVRRL